MLNRIEGNREVEEKRKEIEMSVTLLKKTMYFKNELDRVYKFRIQQ